MTDVPIQILVKCPMLFEHEPCDLVPADDCDVCRWIKRRYSNKIVCRWGERG